MAEAKQENLQLAARLDSMRGDLEHLRRENEKLRKQEQGTKHSEGLPMTPPAMDEGSEGGSRSNSASVVATPTDMEVTSFDWEGLLSHSKHMPLAGPRLEEGEVFW